MTGLSRERALWLARTVLPLEPALRGWLSRHPVAGLEPDDVVQETYAILSSLESVEAIRNVRAYMFQTARSVMLQHLRRARIVPFESLNDVERSRPPIDAFTPERHVAGREALRHVRDLIDGLPKKCREVFTLRKVMGFSQKEIAQRMGISENTVEKHVGKAVRHLMTALADGGEPSAQASKDESPVQLPSDDVQTDRQRRH